MLFKINQIMFVLYQWEYQYKFGLMQDNFHMDNGCKISNYKMGWCEIMSVSINELFEMLSCDNDPQTQDQAIQEAKNIRFFSIFMQPIEDQSVWENCAKIIASKSDEELSIYLYDMFYWLQDMNWPGFEIIYKRIKNMPVKVIIGTYIYCVKKAMQLEDEEWQKYLSGFIENQEIYNLLPEEIQKLMKTHYDAFWGRHPDIFDDVTADE